ncbi:hypothetical protein BC938DRAFT_481367 [Jimgerdemannia flammicorona]|uniref:Uncharacterized protein n=1 Tax=Jimgerdemannia flammicorona TaxID=994334 RepID=A0A433QWX9_9FUNG|nr:hypothetical protein BC938DRAFT_481367 [Jimgerdemannia flammicorona]
MVQNMKSSKEHRQQILQKLVDLPAAGFVVEDIHTQVSAANLNAFRGTSEDDPFEDVKAWISFFHKEDGDPEEPKKQIRARKRIEIAYEVYSKLCFFLLARRIKTYVGSLRKDKEMHKAKRENDRLQGLFPHSIQKHYDQYFFRARTCYLLLLKLGFPFFLGDDAPTVRVLYTMDKRSVSEICDQVIATDPNLNPNLEVEDKTKLIAPSTPIPIVQDIASEMVTNDSNDGSDVVDVGDVGTVDETSSEKHRLSDKEDSTSETERPKQRNKRARLLSDYKGNLFLRSPLRRTRQGAIFGST